MQEYQKGQILLIVVLVMVTALTVGLSVAARSITDTRTSQEASSSEKAFSAAEAGIESLIASSSAGPRNITGSFSNNNTNYNASISNITGTQFVLNNNNPVLKDDSIDVYLATYPNYTNPQSGFITFYWGQSISGCSNAALEFIILSGSTAVPSMSKIGVDPCSPRSTHNNFRYIAPGGGAIQGQVYQDKTTIQITNGLFVRVIPLYAPALVAVQGLCNNVGANCVPFPVQGSLITSTGTADNTQRKLVTYSYFPKLPTEVLQYSLFVPQ